MKRRLTILLLVLFAACGCGKSKPDTLVEGGYDEKEMEAAIARARREVDAFLKELASPTGTGHAVKAPIEDGGQTEHFWLSDVKFQGGKFAGTINNDPGVVKNVKIGDAWTVGKDEISDWMYMRDGKMHGNYTMRPLLKTLPDDEAEKFRAMLAEP